MIKWFSREGGETTRQAQHRAIPIIKKLLQEHRGKILLLEHMEIS